MPSATTTSTGGSVELTARPTEKVVILPGMPNTRTATLKTQALVPCLCVAFWLATTSKVIPATSGLHPKTEETPSSTTAV